MCWAPGAVIPVDQAEVLHQPAERSHARILVKLWFKDDILLGALGRATVSYSRGSVSMP
jgi:hypothetical protein